MPIGTIRICFSSNSADVCIAELKIPIMTFIFHDESCSNFDIMCYLVNFPHQKYYSTDQFCTKNMKHQKPPLKSQLGIKSNILPPTIFPVPKSSHSFCCETSSHVSSSRLNPTIDSRHETQQQHKTLLCSRAVLLASSALVFWIPMISYG